MHRIYLYLSFQGYKSEYINPFLCPLNLASLTHKSKQSWDEPNLAGQSFLLMSLMMMVMVMMRVMMVMMLMMILFIIMVLYVVDDSWCLVKHNTSSHTKCCLISTLPSSGAKVLEPNSFPKVEPGCQPMVLPRPMPSKNTPVTTLPFKSLAMASRVNRFAKCHFFYWDKKGKWRHWKNTTQVELNDIVQWWWSFCCVWSLGSFDYFQQNLLCCTSTILSQRC